MILDIFESEGVEVAFSYLPSWEMFFSMHVLVNSEHHMHRAKWAKKVENDFPKLVKQIRDLADITNAWELLIDIPIWNVIRQMEIIELIEFLRNKNIYKWNDMIQPLGKKMSISERDLILHIIKEYYEKVFRREEMILRPYLTRVIFEEKEKCRSLGIWKWCGTIHTRLEVGEDKLTYQKNHEYVFPKKEITKIYATVSTFLEPHLWLYHENHELEVVKSILVEQAEDVIPKDYVQMFKALGDATRLEVIRCLIKGVHTTKEITKEIGITEAGVSKHLKILSEAGLVKRRRRGHYIEYEFNTRKIDFIPYIFYEMMR